VHAVAVSPLAWMGDAARSVPDVLRPQWLVDTWSGTHGTDHLRALVDNEVSTVVLDRRRLTGTAAVEGTVMDGYAEVGTFRRNVTLDPGRAPWIFHELLELDDDYQGFGFARGFNDQAFERYGRAGANRVGIHAGRTVGGYAWPRQGFELLAEGVDDVDRALDRGTSINLLVHKAREEGRLPAAGYRALKPLLVGPKDVIVGAHHLTSVRDLVERPWGKEVLLGSEWKGERPIDTRGRTCLDTVGPGVADAEEATRYVGARLPAALDPHRAAASIEHHFAALGARVLGTSQTTLKLGAAPEARAFYGVRLGSGQTIDISVDADARTGQLTLLAPRAGSGPDAATALAGLRNEWGIAA
jgi:hypothetical protein